MRPSRALARFAWGVLAYNLAVVLWGAYVRASGSGAGCGAHWPLCNGEVLPRSPTTQMLVEFSHRVSSGLALLAVLALAVWTWRAVERGHPARAGAVGGVVFILTEAAVGAGLVLFRLVADNASMARAMFMSVHLANTFILLAFLALTAYWLSGGPALRLSGRRVTLTMLALGAGALLVTGVSGAVAALGDTLYPAGSLTQGFSEDLSATSHLLIRLRVLHPAIALTAGIAIVLVALRTRRLGPDSIRRPAAAVAFLGLLQMTMGFLNVILLAPIWMQMIHLLVADSFWIALVLLGARSLGDTEAATAVLGN
jgi:heme A synthase